MNNNKGLWLKIGICILGVLMIAGAITYAVLTRQAGTSDAASALSTATGASINSRVLGRLDGLNWVNDVKTKFADKDYIFVILPGDNVLSVKSEEMLSGAMEKMLQDGVSVGYYLLDTQDPELALTARRLSITDLPAMLLFSALGRGAIISGEITETKILQAYFTLHEICIPGTSGCCPKQEINK